MKTSRILLALLILVGITAMLPSAKAEANSRVYVGVDLGGLVAAFDTGPSYGYGTRYVYAPPVHYAPRWHTWRPAPPRPYPPPRWHHHPPPPDHGRYHHWRSHWHHRDHGRGGYHR